MIKAEKRYMDAAIQAALQARQSGDYAIGAVIVRDNQIISSGANRVKTDNDPTAHAEVIAIRGAVKVMGSRHLEDSILYSTHEPCVMCCGVAYFSRIEGIVYGATRDDMKSYRIISGNADWSWLPSPVSCRMVFNKTEREIFIVEEFMREECRKLFHS